MKRRGKVSFFIFAVAIFLSSFVSVEANDVAGTFAISTDGGRISVEAFNAPLGAILNELSQKTGARFTDRTTLVSADTLSVSFSNLSFSEAVTRILKNYSYILDDDSAPNVIILASLPSRENPAAAIEHGTQPERKVSSGVRAVSQTGTPNVNECQALEFSEKDASQMKAQLTVAPASQGRGRRSAKAANESESQYRKEREEEIRQKLDDAKIKRAQRVLGMEKCRNYWEQVLNDISGIQDSRVTALLSDTAQNGMTREIRARSARALWSNTASSQYTNTGDLDALKRLTSSGDPSVSEIAQQALSDYERHTQKD